jgi:hypothetical protein
MADEKLAPNAPEGPIAPPQPTGGEGGEDARHPDPAPDEERDDQKGEPTRRSAESGALDR